MALFKELYDLSLSLDETMHIWPGDGPFKLTPLARFSTGDGVRVSTVETGLHIGTHLDPPGHFKEDGLFIDQMSVADFILPATMVDVEHQGDAGPEDLAGYELAGRAVILRTRNTRNRIYSLPEFQHDFAGLNPAGAEYLVAAGAALVGVDYLSVEREDDPKMPAHWSLCRAGIPILEGLDLSCLPEAGLGTGWTLICLPLKVSGGDGGLCRAVLGR